MANLQSKESNPWNPFEPTRRDIQRTKELSEKNSLVAGVLSVFFLPAGMIYLNRGVNLLKIIGYVYACVFVFALASDSEEQFDGMCKGVGYIGSIAATYEQISTVTNARKRKKIYEQ